MGNLMGLNIPKDYFSDKKKEKEKKSIKQTKKPLSERDQSLNDALKIIRNETEYYIHLSLKDKKKYSNVDVVMVLDKISHRIMELKLK